MGFSALYGGYPLELKQKQNFTAVRSEEGPALDRVRTFRGGGWAGGWEGRGWCEGEEGGGGETKGGGGGGGSSVKCPVARGWRGGIDSGVSSGDGRERGWA